MGGEKRTGDALTLMEDALQKMNDSVNQLRGVIVELNEGSEVRRFDQQMRKGSFT